MQPKTYRAQVGVCTVELRVGSFADAHKQPNDRRVTWIFSMGPMKHTIMWFDFTKSEGWHDFMKTFERNPNAQAHEAICDLNQNGAQTVSFVNGTILFENEPQSGVSFENTTLPACRELLELFQKLYTIWKRYQ